MFYEGRKHMTRSVSLSFETWVRSPRIFTYIWQSKQVRINSLKFERASQPSPPTTTGEKGQVEHFNIEMAFRTTVALSRLSDSWDDAKVKGTRKYERVICEKGRCCRPSSPQFPPFACSRFLNYLGAWNRLVLLWKVGGIRHAVLFVKDAT